MGGGGGGGGGGQFKVYKLVFPCCVCIDFNIN